MRSVPLMRTPRPAPPALIAAQNRAARRQTWWYRAAMAFAPRITRLICQTCGPSTAVTVRVPLPQMVNHRAGICSGGGCAIYRDHGRLGCWCGTPAPLRLIKLNWLRRVAEYGCGCWLWLKLRLSWAHCPAKRW